MVRSGEPSDSSRQGPGQSGTSSGLRRQVLTMVLVMAAVVLLALVATGSGVPLATEGSGGWGADPQPVEQEPVDDSAVAGTDELPPPSPPPGEGVLAVIAQTLIILVGVTALLLTARALLRMFRPPTEPLGLGRPEHWPDASAEMVAAVDGGLAALSSGPVDEVVVACWVGLEDAAAAAGAGRGSAETSAELASRVLDDLHAPPAAVDGLLHRYRRARYSHQPLDEEDRAVAIRSLEEIRAAIARAHA